MDAKIQSQPPPHRQHGERRNDRQTVVAIPTVLNRRLTTRRPGAAHHRLEQKTAFVDQDDAPTPSAGFFLIRGQSFSRHFRTASSSRSRARRSGFWALQPIPRKIRQTCAGWYFTRKCSTITLAILGSVHRSVGNPAARGPRKRIAANSSFR